MIWLVLGSIILCLVFYYYCIKPLDYWIKRGVKQGTPAWLLGDNINIMLRRESFAQAIVRYCNQNPGGRYTGIYQLMFPTLVITDPELLKKITVKDFEHFVDHRSFIPEDAEPLWSKNLFALKGQKWREMRPVLSPSFTSSKMKTMFILMLESAELFVEYFKNKNDDITEVEMKDIFTRFGNDVIASVAFGIKVDSLKDRNNEFYLMGKEATNFSGFWKTVKILGYNLVPKLYQILGVTLFSAKVTKFFFELIDEMIKTREEKGIVRPDMINLLLEARRGDQKHDEAIHVETGFATVEEADLGKVSEFHKKDITNMDIAAQALIFFFAGFDSVTSAMAFVAYELAVNPEIQKKLRVEIEETNSECDGKLTYEALMRMKYMDMVVSEALRKWPSAVAVDRVCTKPYVIQPVTPEEKPLQINKDDVIWIPIYGFHHDPKYYPEPQKFDPERFNDENKHNIQPYTYLPFGMGPRNCIGSRFALLEFKTLFFQLLLNFELVPIKKTNIPLRISKTSFNLQAEGGNWLGFKPIKKQNTR